MGTKMQWTKVLCGAAAAGAMVACAAFAQDPPPPPPGPNAAFPPPPAPDRDGPRRPGATGRGGERNRELFEQVLVARLSNELKLNDEQTVLMVRRYFDFKESGRKLRRDRAELLRALRELVKNDPQNSKAIDAKLGELIDADEAIATSKRGLYERLGEGLDAVTRAKLYVFLQELEGELRRMADDVRKPHNGPDGPPPQGEMRRPDKGPRRMEGRPPGPGPRREGPPPNSTPTDQLPAPPPR